VGAGAALRAGAGPFGGHIVTLDRWLCEPGRNSPAGLAGS